jgi:hypothetical protein
MIEIRANRGTVGAMSDYHSLLERKIKEIEHDPAAMRQVVYEAARLALKRQVTLWQPPLSWSESERHISELENAIVLLEANLTIGCVRKSTEPESPGQGRYFPADDDRREPDFDDAASAGKSTETPPVSSPHRGRRTVRRAFLALSNQFSRTSCRKMLESIGEMTPPCGVPSVASRSRLSSSTWDDAEADESYPRDAAEAARRVARSSASDVMDEPPPLESPGIAVQHRFAASPRNQSPSLRPNGRQASRNDKFLPEDNSTFDEGDTPSRNTNRLNHPRSASHELVLVPDHSPATRRSSPYPVKASDFTASDVIHRPPPEPRRTWGRILSPGFGFAFQLAVAAIAAVAFFVALGGRSPRPALDATGAGAAPVSAPAPVASAEAAPPAAETRPPFPRPISYGVYAISDNQLIGLDTAQTSPFDPRAKSVLQITKAARTVIAGAHLAFLIYRRDMITSAPDKVPIRIAARIAKIMNFDMTGKAVVAPPPTDSWFIRDHGYELQVSPIPDSQEMVLARPEDPAFSFPPGRYELLLGGQPYDFVIAGAVTDPAHCVESVWTGRGPVFYECRPQ